MLTRFKNKSAEVNKRIRLTPVNGAIANISESQGAVAKDGEDVLICLSPQSIFSDVYLTTLSSPMVDPNVTKAATMADFELFKSGAEFIRQEGDNWYIDLDKSRGYAMSYIKDTETGLYRLKGGSPFALAFGEYVQERLKDLENDGPLLKLTLYISTIAGTEPAEISLTAGDLAQTQPMELEGHLVSEVLTGWCFMLVDDSWFEVTTYNRDGSERGKTKFNAGINNTYYPESMGNFSLVGTDIFSFSMDKVVSDGLNVITRSYEGDKANEPVALANNYHTSGAEAQVDIVKPYSGASITPRPSTYRVTRTELGAKIENILDPVYGYGNETMNAQIGFFYPDQILEVVETSHDVEYKLYHLSTGTLLIFFFAATLRPIAE